MDFKVNNNVKTKISLNLYKNSDWSNLISMRELYEPNGIRKQSDV